MERDENLFVAARKASGMTQEETAVTCKLSVGTFCGREKEPLDFRLRELVALYRCYGEGARGILKTAIDSLFWTCS